MESELLIGWQQEKAELQQEVRRLQEALADSRAEGVELQARSRALSQRLSQSACPALGPSEGEEREWRRRLRESREREARQALLIHRLQNKLQVLEYRDRCQRLELQVEDEHTQLISTERIREQHSDSLESALIRLEEEQHRSVGLADTNALLREQLSQSGRANRALREDLQKLTADWTTAAEEAEQREADWQREREAQLLSVWRSVVSLRRHCYTLKTA
uniref:Rootletin-like coiled-coil domain-containing protein n=1 Tax=Amphiprion percula TaxID=161767 RepID=A0A3P8SU97_AMPPE